MGRSPLLRSVHRDGEERCRDKAPGPRLPLSRRDAWRDSVVSCFSGAESGFLQWPQQARHRVEVEVSGRSGRSRQQVQQEAAAERPACRPGRPAAKAQRAKARSWELCAREAPLRPRGLGLRVGALWPLLRRERRRLRPAERLHRGRGRGRSLRSGAPERRRGSRTGSRREPGPLSRLFAALLQARIGISSFGAPKMQVPRAKPRLRLLSGQAQDLPRSPFSSLPTCLTCLYGRRCSKSLHFRRAIRMQHSA